MNLPAKLFNRFRGDFYTNFLVIGRIDAIPSSCYAVTGENLL